MENAWIIIELIILVIHIPIGEKQGKRAYFI